MFKLFTSTLMVDIVENFIRINRKNFSSLKLLKFKISLRTVASFVQEWRLYRRRISLALNGLYIRERRFWIRKIFLSEFCVSFSKWSCRIKRRIQIKYETTTKRHVFRVLKLPSHVHTYFKCNFYKKVRKIYSYFLYVFYFLLYFI